jgi:glutamate/aspartate transport system substrate-binding protein
MTRLAAVMLLAVLACASATARAQDGAPLTGTLKTVLDRGTILIGYRVDAVPFAFLNKAAQPGGYSLDLCHAVAADVAATLHRDLLEPDAPSWQLGVRIVYVPVAPDARLPKVIAGEVDLECGSTTATDERAKTVAFSPVFFLAGTKLMVSRTAGLSSYRNLTGRSVAVAAGTTNAAVMRGLAGTVVPPIKVVETRDLDAAYALLVAGTVDAFASDDILLYGFLATHADRQRFAIVGDFLSFEPYAITLRRDDPAFAALVRGSFTRMASEGTLNRLYERWFVGTLPTGERLDLPMSAHLSEIYQALGQTD